MIFINKNNVVFSFLLSLIFISSAIGAIEIQRKYPGQSIVALHTLIKNYPLATRSQQTDYEKEHIHTALLTAKALYEQAHHAILEVLQEIDTRISYWQYQKDHSWAYFFTKNPLKWVTGETQEVEIENKLETLKSHQGELFVLLGQLSKLENEFNLGFKDTFLEDPALGYEWIDNLLNTLTRIKTDTIVVEENKNSFVERLSQIKLKLQKVSSFKEMILADMSETIIPSRLERNWLKYSALLLALRYGYSNYDVLSTMATNYALRSKDYLSETLKPVKELFFPSSQQSLLIQEENIAQTRTTMTDLLNVLEKNKIITPEEKNIVIEDVLKGSYASFQNLWDQKIVNSWWNLKRYGAQSFNVLGQLSVFFPMKELQESFEGVRNIALLSPAALLGLGGYYGLTNTYKWLTKKDYNSLRNSLIAINSLFIDPTKTLTDEQYGQMMYLIYKTKQLAIKQLSRKRSLLEEFIADLERVQSREYNIIAKRNIIEDMFKKYDFLGFIQQKSA